MKLLPSIYALFGLTILLSGCSSEEPASPSASKPPSEGRGHGSVEARLAELAKDGPVFLYFTKESCGSNPQAVPLVQAVYKAYEGKAKMYAVVNASDAAYDGWKGQYGLTMPGLADEDMAMVRHFGFEESQHLVKVDRGGRAEEIEGGYGRPALETLNKELAAAAGVEPAKLDVAGAPESAAFG